MLGITLSCSLCVYVYRISLSGKGNTASQCCLAVVVVIVFDGEFLTIGVLSEGTP